MSEELKPKRIVKDVLLNMPMTFLYARRKENRRINTNYFWI